MRGRTVRGRPRRWLRTLVWVVLPAAFFVLLVLAGQGRGRAARTGASAAARPSKVTTLSLRRTQGWVDGVAPAAASEGNGEQVASAAVGPAVAPPAQAGGAVAAAPAPKPPPPPPPPAPAPAAPAAKPAAPAEKPPVSPSSAPTRGAAAFALAKQSPPHTKYEDLPLPVTGTDGPLAPPEAPLPDMCYNDLGWHKDEDTQCYLDMAASFRERSASDEHAPFCWGYSGRRPGEEPLLFHTMALTAFASQTPLLLWSFLATQCCDAVLWFWMSPTVAASFNKDDPPVVLPPHLRHRVVYKTFDADAEWSRVSADFPRANATSLRLLMSFEDIRYVSDWGRQVVMYSYGGTWIDIDTVFLQDFRPALRYTPFAYRAGIQITINNAVLRLGRRPNAITKEIMDGAIERVDPLPHGIFKTIGLMRMGEPDVFHYLSELLFDFMWMRFVDEETPPLRQVHPEITVRANWDDFFKPHNDSMVQRMRATPFLPGSYSYHWHNRYDKGLPADSWAGVLTARYQKLASEKTICELNS